MSGETMRICTSCSWGVISSTSSTRMGSPGEYNTSALVFMVKPFLCVDSLTLGTKKLTGSRQSTRTSFSALIISDFTPFCRDNLASQIAGVNRNGRAGEVTRFIRGQPQHHLAYGFCGGASGSSERLCPVGHL